MLEFSFCQGLHVVVFRRVDEFESCDVWREGAEGLDLSFATHLFLMDSILDLELEEQVSGSRQARNLLIKMGYRLSAESTGWDAAFLCRCISS